MPLSTIFNSQEGHSIVLLTDCQRQPAFTLLKSHIVTLTALVETVHVYLYETRQDKLLNDLPNSILSRVQIHNLLHDPLGWGEDATSSDTVVRNTFPTCAYNNRYSIIIDSLSSMIQYSSAHQVCQWLHSLTNRTASKSHSGSQSECRQVIAIVHSDLHPRSTIQMLEHTADIVVALDAIEPSRCKVIEKSRSGKKLPRITYETFTIDQYFNVRSELVSSAKSNAAAAPVSSKTPAAAMSKLTDNLTFNSTVSRGESEARSKLVLPYVHTGQSGTVGGRADTKNNDGGEELMLDDDEEDPDDDLDI